MLRRISIAEVPSAGVTLKPEEAIAIAQQLIRPPTLSSYVPDAAHPSHAQGSDPTHLSDATHPSDANELRRAPHPPFGPPAPENVFLGSDGSVSCAACDVTLAISEVACLLQQILPLETSHIPGSLRYTIARALLEVDAPPFDSLLDFSEVLARYERGERATRVGCVLDRARAAISGGAVDAVPIVDRRRTTPEIFELRRQLRESDARLYDQRLALDSIGRVRPPTSRFRHVAVAAGLVIGLGLVGAGELMHPVRPFAAPERRDALADGGETLVESRRVTGVTVSESPLAPTAPDQSSPAATAVDRNAFRVPAARDRFSRTSSANKSRSPHITKVRTTSRTQRSSSGVLDKLHLQWLRKKFVIRRDDL